MYGGKVKNNTVSFVNVLKNNSPNRVQALTTIRDQEIELAKRLLLFVTYYELDVTESLSTRDRNAIIRTRYFEGEPMSTLAKEFGISPQRVYQIINFKNK